MNSLSTETRTALAQWAEKAGCRLLVIYGSAARESTRDGSDVDVAVSFESLPAPMERLRMIGEIQDCTSPRPADVVFLHVDTDPVLRFEVFRDGKALYESTSGLFIEERVRAVMLHHDALPFRRALMERVVTGSPP